jgi:hypothetical protein
METLTGSTLRWSIVTTLAALAMGGLNLYRLATSKVLVQGAGLYTMVAILAVAIGYFAIRAITKQTRNDFRLSVALSLVAVFSTTALIFVRHV